MKILFDAISARMGGAATYLRNVARELENVAPDDEFICILPEDRAATLRGLASNLRVIGLQSHLSNVRRLWFGQVTLRRMLRKEKIDVLYSTANFGMFACPCRQVLLVRNLLYFSRPYEQLLATAGFTMRLENSVRRWLVCRSVKSADTVLTPSQAMMDALVESCPEARGKTVVNRYGVTPARAARAYDNSSRKRGATATLLYTSLYAEHKNVGTLLKALQELLKSGAECVLITPADPDWQGPRQTAAWKRDSQIANDPALSRHLQFTGVLNAEALAALYGVADIFVYPSIIESFGHPLLEAMAAGLPVVAADAPVNRELCADSAIYFSPYDPTDCARQIRRVMEDSSLACELIQRGLKRSQDFRWQQHSAQLVQLLTGNAGFSQIEKKPPGRRSMLSRIKTCIIGSGPKRSTASSLRGGCR